MPPPAEESANGMICSPTQSLDTAWVGDRRKPHDKFPGSAEWCRVLGTSYMKKTFLWFSLVGMAVAGILVQYAYYSNHHRDAPRLDDYAYLVICPPSILLMATESGSTSGQVLGISLVVILNGLLYGIVAMVCRRLLT